MELEGNLSDDANRAPMRRGGEDNGDAMPLIAALVPQEEQTMCRDLHLHNRGVS